MTRELSRPAPDFDTEREEAAKEELQRLVALRLQNNAIRHATEQVGKVTAGGEAQRSREDDAGSREELPEQTERREMEPRQEAQHLVDDEPRRRATDKVHEEMERRLEAQRLAEGDVRRHAQEKLQQDMQRRQEAQHLLVAEDEVRRRAQETLQEEIQRRQEARRLVVPETPQSGIGEQAREGSDQRVSTDCSQMSELKAGEEGQLQAEEDARQCVQAKMSQEMGRRQAEDVARQGMQEKIQEEVRRRQAEDVARRHAQEQMQQEVQRRQAEMVARQSVQDKMQEEVQRRQAERVAQQCVQAKMQEEVQRRQAENVARQSVQDKMQEEVQRRQAERVARQCVQDKMQKEVQRRQAENVARQSVQDRMQEEVQRRQAENIARQSVQDKMQEELQRRQAEAVARRCMQEQMQEEMQRRQPAPDAAQKPVEDKDSSSEAFQRHTQEQVPERVQSHGCHDGKTHQEHVGVADAKSPQMADLRSSKETQPHAEDDAQQCVQQKTHEVMQRRQPAHARAKAVAAPQTVVEDVVDCPETPQLKQEKKRQMVQRQRRQDLEPPGDPVSSHSAQNQSASEAKPDQEAQHQAEDAARAHVQEKMQEALQRRLHSRVQEKALEASDAPKELTRERDKASETSQTRIEAGEVVQLQGRRVETTRDSASAEDMHRAQGLAVKVSDEAQVQAEEVASQRAQEKLRKEVQRRQTTQANSLDAAGAVVNRKNGSERVQIRTEDGAHEGAKGLLHARDEDPERRQGTDDRKVPREQAQAVERLGAEQPEKTPEEAVEKKSKPQTQQQRLEAAAREAIQRKIETQLRPRAGPAAEPHEAFETQDCPLADTFRPPVGHLCSQTQRKLLQLRDEHSLILFLETCTSSSNSWSHINIVQAFKLLKQLKLQSADCSGLKERAAVLLDEALATLRQIKGGHLPPVILRVSDWKNPSEELHEVLFVPQTAAMLVHALASVGANLNGHATLFKKAASFLLPWLQRQESVTVFEPADMASIAWGFAAQAADCAVGAESSLVKLLAGLFERSVSKDELNGGFACTSLDFSKAIWGLAKLATRAQTTTASVREFRPTWALSLLPKAADFALHHLQQFKPKELSAAVWAFGKLGSTNACRPFLVATSKWLASRERIRNFNVQDAMCLAEQLLGFTENSAEQHPKEHQLSSEISGSHDELCNAVRRLLCTIAEDAVARIDSYSPSLLAVLMRTLAKAGVKHEPLCSVALLQITAKLNAPQRWTPQEVVAAMAGIGESFTIHSHVKHSKHGHCAEVVVDGKLVGSLTSFLEGLCKWCKQPGHLNELKPKDLCEFIRGLTCLTDGSAFARRLLDRAQCGIVESVATAVSKTGVDHLHKLILEEVVVGLAKLNADLQSVPGLLNRVAAELEAASQEPRPLLGASRAFQLGQEAAPSKYRATRLLWAVALHSTGVRQTSLFKHVGLEQAVLTFVAKLGAEALEAISALEKSVESVAKLEEGACASEKSYASSCGIHATELFSALWAMVTLSLAQGVGATLQHLPVLKKVASVLCQCRVLFDNSPPPETAHCLWALGRMGARAGAQLRSFMASACKDSADVWVEQLLQGQSFPGHLLWGAVMLTADNPPQELLETARHVVTRLPELEHSRIDGNAFIALLWALVTLDILRPKGLADAIWGALCTGSPALSRICAWEWSLLHELLLYASPRTWPKSLLSSSRQAWDQERKAALRQMSHDAPTALSHLSRLLERLSSKSASLAGEVPGDLSAHASYGGLPADAIVPDQKLAIELVPDKERTLPNALALVSDSSIAGAPGQALATGGSRALKWLILVQRGWTVACLPTSALQDNPEELAGLARVIDLLPRQGSAGIVQVTAQIADMPTIVDESASAKRQRLASPTTDASQSVPQVAHSDSEQAPAPKRPRMNVAAEPEGHTVSAEGSGPEVQSSGLTAPSSSDLVLIELSHGAKRKRLKLAPTTLIGRLIQDYGKVVKGEGSVIVVDEEGIEQSVDIELGVLAAEAKLHDGDTLKLQLKLDDWLL